MSRPKPYRKLRRSYRCVNSEDLHMHADALGNGAKPPDNQKMLPVVAVHPLWQAGAGMNEREKQMPISYWD